MDLTHASWFSGAGGLDLGLERAGWSLVSHAETEPYPAAILRHRWPTVPNLGDVLGAHPPGEWSNATLWSGGFPCQDLSVAGRRRGLGGDRSGLALGFLALVGRHHPPAVLIENVPGLLVSHSGRDLGTLLHRLGNLGYGWAYRVLDGSRFGVPHHRRRVFIVALRLDRCGGANRATEVLPVGPYCPSHPPAGPGGGRSSDAPGGREIGVDIAGNLTHRYAKGVNTSADDGAIVLEAPPPHPVGGGADHGVAGRVDPRPGLVHPLIPQGLDGHRYRAIGNGVIAPVAEWIGRRLARVLVEVMA